MRQVFWASACSPPFALSFSPSPRDAWAASQKKLQNCLELGRRSKERGRKRLCNILLSLRNLLAGKKHWTKSQEGVDRSFLTAAFGYPILAGDETSINGGLTTIKTIITTLPPPEPVSRTK